VIAKTKTQNLIRAKALEKGQCRIRGYEKLSSYPKNEIRAWKTD